MLLVGERTDLEANTGTYHAHAGLVHLCVDYHGFMQNYLISLAGSVATLGAHTGVKQASFALQKALMHCTLKVIATGRRLMQSLSWDPHRHCRAVPKWEEQELNNARVGMSTLT